MCGIFYWTTDIGGFYGGDPSDPRFQELIVRWFQFGVFCPIFRLHGFRLPYPKDPHTCDTIELTGGPNEVWSFGEEAYNIIKELLFMRERIKPYIIEQMKKASSEGIPIMRPLFLDFPEDETSWEIEDEFLFGPDILVAPILYEGVKSRKIYLPKGAKWRDVNYGELYDGGIWIEDYPADLKIIPIFLKNDIKLPLKG
jgi:alpha-D-xyloside xylohydrolase